jgi:hypothetical protein
VPISANGSLVSAGPSSVVFTSTGGTFVYSVSVSGWTTFAGNFSLPSTPNSLVNVEATPTYKFGYHENGLGLFKFVPAGFLPLNHSQHPYKITTGDDNLNFVPTGEVNFIQIDLTTAPLNLAIEITGNVYTTDTFAVFCSSQSGVLGTFQGFFQLFEQFFYCW